MCLAVPGKLVEITDEDPVLRRGKVSFGGVAKTISLAYVPEAVIGDYVTVHVGFALSVLDEEEAHQTFEYMREMNELADLEDGGISEQPATSERTAEPP